MNIGFVQPIGSEPARAKVFWLHDHCVLVLALSAARLIVWGSTRFQL